MIPLEADLLTVTKAESRISRGASCPAALVFYSYKFLVPTPRRLLLSAAAGKCRHCIWSISHSATPVVVFLLGLWS